MPYKHYTITLDELNIETLLKQNQDKYILFTHGGSDFSQVPRKNYYEILVTRHSKCKCFNETIYEDKLTVNRVILLGIVEILNKISKTKEVIIVNHTRLGFERAIKNEKGVNFDYVYFVLNTINHKDLNVKIYSLILGAEKIKDIIKNPLKYNLIPFN